MSRAAAARLVALSFAAAALGCSGYSDGTGQSTKVPVMTQPAPPAPTESFDAAPPRIEPAPQPKHDAALLPEAALDANDSATADEDAGQPELDAGHVLANVRLVQTAAEPAPFLADELGRPLYMFSGDVAGAAESECLYECAHEWPPFDVELPAPSAELMAAEISRFHRQDGAWQVTYKGHPLYYRAVEAGLPVVTGDGVDGQWFVGRDYLAFLSTARSFAPEGGTLLGEFLTDGFGRTLYVCLGDTPGTASSDAVSSCDAECARKRPIFPASAAARTRLLPTVIDASELDELTRADGMAQLTYRGWPLYYFSDDVLAGSTAGHNDSAWRAFDPVSFARQREPGAP